MSDQYNTQQQAYPSNAGDGPAYYTPSDHQHQSHAYGYETHPSHPGQEYQYAHGDPRYNAYSNNNQSYGQSPTVYHPQITETQYDYLSPSSAITGADNYGHDENRLSPHYEPRGHGSNAEYYEASSLHERSRSSHRRSSSHDNRERDETDTDVGEGERGLAGALVGGTTGYYLGHKKSHGLLGAVGGALLGNFLENKIEEQKDDGHSSHHGRRRRRHHHHHHGSRSRSRSRHSHRSTDS
ncbi:hypothetical protein BDV12DRAFT_159374 [Aspergillus spectabilis]